MLFDITLDQDVTVCIAASADYGSNRLNLMVIVKTSLVLQWFLGTISEGCTAEVLHWAAL